MNEKLYFHSGESLEKKIISFYKNNHKHIFFKIKNDTHVSLKESIDLYCKEGIGKNISKVESSILAYYVNLLINFNALSIISIQKLIIFYRQSANVPNFAKKYMLQKIIFHCMDNNINIFILQNKGNFVRTMLKVLYYFSKDDIGAQKLLYLTMDYVKKESIEKDKLQNKGNFVGRMLQVLYYFSKDYIGAQKLLYLTMDYVKKESIEKDKPQNIKRVAVCISGVIRNNKKSMDTIINTIVKPLNADLFIHTWDKGQEWSGLGGAGDFWIARLLGSSFKQKAPDELDSKEFLKKYFPKTFQKLDRVTEFDITEKKLKKIIPNIQGFSIENEDIVMNNLSFPNSKLMTRGNLNQAKMFYGIYKAFKLMERYESISNIKYDYVVKMRPDMNMSGEISDEYLSKLKEYEIGTNFTVYGPSDQFYIGRRNAIGIVSRLWESIIEVENLSPFKGYEKRDSHALLLLWLLKYDLKIKHTTLNREIVSIENKEDFLNIREEFIDDCSLEKTKELTNIEEIKIFFNLLMERK